MKRKLLIIALGITFLIVITAMGSMVESLAPQHVTPAVQTAQVGTYQVSLRINPNPPLIDKPATLSLQILHQGSGQTVSKARVTIASSMETMNMGTETAVAQEQRPGLYVTQAHFSMSGTWAVRVVINEPGIKSKNTTFDITAR